MSGYRVLVDSSVWIDYFKSGNVPLLDQMIIEDLVCTNELILTELSPFLEHKGKFDIVENLQELETIPLSIDWSLIRKYQVLNLQNGVNKVGIPDLIILQQVIQEKISLFTFDKHFKLMQDYLNFELIN
ncbi:MULTISPECIES: PIN domain-containing protein [Cyclobacteriaceae]|uniref:PIN domain protein n=2 Tax=Cyclobacteriaceae TaxID=563798 RepID=S2DMJ4_INDAL|nr:MULTISPECIES: PIN domain-containing protein [Cyclobacteriaceae]EOZ98420.1 PIN domain protein [Indibacter alkaliphilus LW1]MBW3467916.1 PIN domain-containing protein [Arthrospiribacter ruber]